MEILSDRIGILLKYGKLMGNLTKRYFFIDNKGVLYYVENEKPILDLLKYDSYDNEKFVENLTKSNNPNSSNCKSIHLNECSISSVKTFLDGKFDLRGRSYFELFLKSREFRSILIFGWKEEFVSSLHDYVASFRAGEDVNLENTNNMEYEKELHGFMTENSKMAEFGATGIVMTNKLNNIDDTINNFNLLTNTNPTTNNGRLFSNTNSVSKLGGKFVNQKDWNKECIRIVNPTSNLTEYEETWVELENGSNYSGSVRNGMPHGFGKEYRPDGSLYTGFFNKGKWHGAGTLTNETLDSYQGEFIDGCICGI